jgi:hypothetical protein
MSSSRSWTCGIALIAALTANPNAIAAQRTFVASFGDDAAACTLAAPCRGFTAALAQTDAHGEIVVLDSAGYGRVTINKSVTIAAPAGIYAGITVFAGTNGIDINRFDGVVVLRGLMINGQGGDDGINFDSGVELHVENCVVSNMSRYGFYSDASGARVFVKDSVFRGTAGQGVHLVNFAAAHLDRVRIERSESWGLLIWSDNARAAATVKDSSIVENGETAVRAVAYPGAEVRLSIEGSMITGNAGWLSVGGVRIESVGGSFDATLVRNQIKDNGGHALWGSASQGGAAHIIASDNTIVSNDGDGLGLAISDGTLVASRNTIGRNTGFGIRRVSGTVVSRGNNDVRDNGAGETSGVIVVEPLI